MPAPPPRRRAQGAAGARGGSEGRGKPTRAGDIARKTGRSDRTGRADAPRGGARTGRSATGRGGNAGRTDPVARRAAERVARSASPPDQMARAKAKGWGGVARRGAHVLGEDAETSASGVWREAVRQSGRTAPDHSEWEPEQWKRVPDKGPRRRRDKAAPAPEAAPPPAPAAGRTRKKKGDGSLPQDVASDVSRASGRHGKQHAAQLAEATRAYQRDRYAEARKLLRPLAETMPDVAPVRELYGLTLYRLGRWSPAIKELEAFAERSGSVDQHPVLADCYRALGRHRKVDQVWDDLRRGGAGVEVVAEGRIVVAGSLADRDDLPAAISLLEQGGAAKEVRNPKPHHVRLWYALADLYERAGEIPKARDLFKRVARTAGESYDATERLAALG